MANQTLVWVTTKFHGFHRWKDAPDDVAFLRNWHRHLFGVRVEVEVSHGNRQVEFFQLKDAVEKYARETFSGQQFEHSCEHLAEFFMKQFNATKVTVDEDEENGATVMQITPAVSHPLVSTIITKPFCGTEAEGPHRGKKVLFIPGSCSAKKYRESVTRFLEIMPCADRVYYGAGNDRRFRRKTYLAILEYMNAGNVDVEVETVTPKILNAVQKGTTIISLNPEDTMVANYIKIIDLAGNRVVWKDTENCDVEYITSLNDPLFSQDKNV